MEPEGSSVNIVGSPDYHENQVNSLDLAHFSVIKVVFHLHPCHDCHDVWMASGLMLEKSI